MHFKLKALVTAMFLAVTFSLFGQNYSITPADTIVDSAPFNDIYHFNFLQNNLTTGSLIFSYEKITTIYPIGWIANLCDNGTCFDGFPESGTMDTVFNGDVGLMSVGINPIEISGVSLIQYAIWEASTTDIVDTLTWIISAGAPDAIINNTDNNAIQIFSNQNNQIVIHSEFNNGFQYYISNLEGKIFVSGTSNGKDKDINTMDLNLGIYLIYILNDEQLITAKQLLIGN